MRSSHKIIMAAVVFMLMGLKPDFATFLPQIAKVGLAAVLLIIGFYMMWKERQW